MGQIILKFMFSLVMLGIVTAIGLAIREIYDVFIEIYHRKTLRYESILYNGVVVNKKCVEYSGLEKYIYEKEYNIYIKCQDKEHCIDERELYQKLKIGDAIQIYIHHGYNKDNELKDVYVSVKD